MAVIENRRKNWFFYGWVIVGVCFISNFVAAGFSFYSFSVFFKPLTEYFGWSREMTSYGPAIAIIVSAAYAPLLGRLVDRMGGRLIISIGAIAFGLAFVFMSQITSLWQYCLLFGVLLSIGRSQTGGLTTSTCVVKWFERRRGTAIGISTMGVSLSGVVMPFFALYLLRTYGWRTGFFVFGLLAWIIILPLSAGLLRRSPKDVGLLPDGDIETEAELAGIKVTGPEVSPREALRMTAFWKITFAFALGFIPLGPMLVHQVAFLTDMGLPEGTAALILAIVAGAGTLGKLVFGFSTDRFDTRFAIAISFFLQILGVYFILTADSMADIIAFSLFFGFGMGGMIPLNAIVRAEYFGSKFFGSISGIARPAITVFQAVGQPFAGRVFDMTGSYHDAFIVFIFCYLAGAFLILSLKPSKSPENLQGGH